MSPPPHTHLLPTAFILENAQSFTDTGLSHRHQWAEEISASQPSSFKLLFLRTGSCRGDVSDLMNNIYCKNLTACVLWRHHGSTVNPLCCRLFISESEIRKPFLSLHRNKRKWNCDLQLIFSKHKHKKHKTGHSVIIHLLLLWFLFFSITMCGFHTLPLVFPLFSPTHCLYNESAACTTHSDALFNSVGCGGDP